MDIKPIETEYKGYKFRSRLEARWAVFFDACGVKWEYEPEGFDLGDGIYYLPDFRLLHKEYDELGRGKNLWIEVKGVMTQHNANQICRFIRSGQPLLVVGNIPEESFYQDVATKHEECWLYYNHPYGEFDYQIPVVPSIAENKNFDLILYDHELRRDLDWDYEKTRYAYKKARQARFERR